jgi:hypothetical protein
LTAGQQDDIVIESTPNQRKEMTTSNTSKPVELDITIRKILDATKLSDSYDALRTATLSGAPVTKANLQVPAKLVKNDRKFLGSESVGSKLSQLHKMGLALRVTIVGRTQEEVNSGAPSHEYWVTTPDNEAIVKAIMDSRKTKVEAKNDLLKELISRVERMESILDENGLVLS